jgi:hypothetical protein
MKLVNNEYVLEVDDLLNYSEIEEPDLKDTFGDKYDLHLAQLSRKTYRAMYSAYAGVKKKEQKLGLQYLINSSDESTTYQNVIRQAIIEYVRGAIISGLDLAEYENEALYPQNVKQELRNGGLWIVAELQYNEEDIA